MTTFNRMKEDIMVWSIIIAVFALLTLVAVNFDQIRKSRLFNKASNTSFATPEKRVAQPEFFQPGHTVVVAH